MAWCNMVVTQFFYKFHFFTFFVSLYINTSTVKILKDFERSKVEKMSCVQRLYLKQGHLTWCNTVVSQVTTVLR